MKLKENLKNLFSEDINGGYGGLDQTETYGTTQHVTTICGGENPSVKKVKDKEEEEYSQNVTDQIKNGMMGVTEEVHAVSGPVNSVNPWDSTEGNGRVIHSEEEYEMIPENLRNLVEEAIEEKFASKAQQRYFYAQAAKGGKKGKIWKKRAKEFSSKTNFDKLPDKVEESKKDKDVMDVTLMDAFDDDLKNNC
jgi:hypothetical protein